MPWSRVCVNPKPSSAQERTTRLPQTGALESAQERKAPPPQRIGEGRDIQPTLRPGLAADPAQEIGSPVCPSPSLTSPPAVLCGARSLCSMSIPGVVARPLQARSWTILCNSACQRATESGGHQPCRQVCLRPRNQRRFEILGHKSSVNICALRAHRRGEIFLVELGSTGSNISRYTSGHTHTARRDAMPSRLTCCRMRRPPSPRRSSHARRTARAWGVGVGGRAQTAASATRPATAARAAQTTSQRSPTSWWGTGAESAQAREARAPWSALNTVARLHHRGVVGGL